MPFKTNFRSEVLPDGKVIVYDVPIFAVCEKQGIKFTEAWIDRAVAYHRKGERNGMAWPTHIHHTGEPDGRPVLPAGAWQNTRKQMVRTKDGELVPGVVVDLVFTDEDAARRAKLGQLLWRSPEIPLTAAIGEKAPRFKSLALLDRDAPHNDDLPLLTFRGSTIRFRKKVSRLVARASIGADPVVAFAETGDTLFALMEPTTMTKPKNAEDAQLRFEDDADTGSDSGGGSEGGGSEGGGSSWKSKLDALKSCKIPVEDIPDVKAAIEEFTASLGGDGEDEEPVMDEALVEDEAPAPDLDDNVDGPADPMEDLAGAGDEEDEEEIPLKDESPDIVRLRDELLKLKADALAEKKLRVQDRLEREYEKAVDAAAAQLQRKGVTREEIVAFASDEPLARRAKAVKKFAATMDEKLLDRDADFEDHIDFHQNGGQNVPDEVIKFQADGHEVYEGALHQYRMWKAQPEDRRERIPLARWLEINNPKGGNPHFATGG